MLVNGEVAGFDIISLASAFAQLHPKLVKSYVLETLLEKNEHSITPEQAGEKACSFLKEAAACELKEFPAIGYGQDCRFNSKNMAGTALVHNDNVIHTAFFRVDPLEHGGQMAPLRQRRHNFI